MSKKSSNFAAVIKTTQSFLYLKIINRLIPYRKKDAAKRPSSFLGKASNDRTLAQRRNAALRANVLFSPSLTKSPPLRESRRGSSYLIISQPMYGCSAAGIRIPSSVWLFSSSAATIRGKARAEPFKVWQRVTFLSS